MFLRKMSMFLSQEVAKSVINECCFQENTGQKSCPKTGIFQNGKMGLVRSYRKCDDYRIRKRFRLESSDQVYGVWSEDVSCPLPTGTFSLQARAQQKRANSFALFAVWYRTRQSIFFFGIAQYIPRLAVQQFTDPVNICQRNRLVFSK